MEAAHRLLENMRSASDSACVNKLRNEAITCFQRGLGVTHDMEKNLMAALHKSGFTVIVGNFLNIHNIHTN